MKLSIKIVLISLFFIIIISILSMVLNNSFKEANFLRKQHKEEIKKIEIKNDSLLLIINITNVKLRDSIDILIYKDSIKTTVFNKQEALLKKEINRIKGSYKELSNDSLVNLAIHEYEKVINNN
jgi:hypothetical protein